LLLERVVAVNKLAAKRVALATQRTVLEKLLDLIEDDVEEKKEMEKRKE
jgi:hypothetical protein